MRVTLFPPFWRSLEEGTPTQSFAASLHQKNNGCCFERLASRHNIRIAYGRAPAPSHYESTTCPQAAPFIKGWDSSFRLGVMTRRLRQWHHRLILPCNMMCMSISSMVKIGATAEANLRSEEGWSFTLQTWMKFTRWLLTLAYLLICSVWCSWGRVVLSRDWPGGAWIIFRREDFGTSAMGSVMIELRERCARTFWRERWFSSIHWPIGNLQLTPCEWKQGLRNMNNWQWFHSRFDVC